MPAERFVLAGNAAQAVLDPVRHGLAHTFGRIASRASPTGQPVGARELIGDRLDLHLGTSDALGVVAIPRASARSASSSAIRSRSRACSRVVEHDVDRSRASRGTGTIAGELAHVDLPPWLGEQARQVSQSLCVAKMDRLVLVGQHP